MNEIKPIVYTSNPPCPKCKVLKKKLDDTGIEYDVFDNVEEMIDMGIENVPMIKVGDSELLGFSQAIKWVNEIGNNKANENK